MIGVNCMNTSLEHVDIYTKLNNIFKNRFDIDIFDKELDINIDDNLLGVKFKLRARDLIYLLNDIEKEFDLTISENDIYIIKFNTLNNIMNIIVNNLELKEMEII